MITEIKRSPDDDGGGDFGAPICPPNCGAALAFFLNGVGIGEPWDDLSKHEQECLKEAASKFLEHHKAKKK